MSDTQDRAATVAALANSPLQVITTLRRDLWRAGYRPVAVYSHDSDAKTPGKQPIGAGWGARARRNPPEAAELPAEWKARNTGILCDGLRPIDIDIEDVDMSARIEKLTRSTFGDGGLFRRRSNSGKLLILYRAAEGKPKKRSTKGTGKNLIEVLGYGNQFVAYGTHPSGVPYEWDNGEPVDLHVDALPAVTEEQISAFLAEAGALIGAAPPRATRGGTTKRAASDLGQVGDIRDLVDAMEQIPNNGPANWDEWYKIGMALCAGTEGCEEGRAAFHKWSARNDAYAEAAVDERWNHWTHSSPATQIGAGKIIAKAQEANPGWQKPSTRGADFGPLPPIEPNPDAPEIEALERFDEITESAATRAFVPRFKGRIVFDHSEKRWLRFVAGVGWQRDETGQVLFTARAFVHAARNQWGFEQSKPAGSERFPVAMLKGAECYPNMAVTASSWDADPMILGVPGGHVDLRTGGFCPADPAHYVRRRTSVAPAATGCPLWLAFLGEATGGDPELLAWLQRLAGYCLTGDVREEMFSFFYGDGGNGKGTFLDTVQRIMGDYAYEAPVKVFRADPTGRTDPEGQFAKMVGIRLVVTTETEQGDALAESTIKKLTGNEGKLNARKLYCDPFEFTPQAKLVIVGNHAPSLKGRTESMQRRMRVVPFSHKPKVKDPDLKDKLRAEHPSILQWMIDGCLMWQRERLGTCDAVAGASESYFEDQDTLGLWMAERCRVAADASCGAAAALEDFNAWLRPRGEKPVTSKPFKEAMMRRPGITWGQIRAGARVCGVALIEAAGG